jgi:hypothetical protein
MESGSSVTPGEWFHLALVIVPESMNIYLNGAVDGDLGWTFTEPRVPQFSLTRVVVGGSIDGAHENLLGEFDEFYIARSANIRTGTTSTFDPTVAPDSLAMAWAHYSFDEGEGSYTADELGGRLAEVLPYSDWVESTVPTAED